MAVLSAGPHTDAFTEGVQGVQPGRTGGLGTGLDQEPPCVPGPCGWLWPAALLPEVEAVEGGGQGPSCDIPAPSGSTGQKAGRETRCRWLSDGAGQEGASRRGC